jgi:dTDP-4-dehydrorhamnose 3,5-epimerase
MIFTETALEGAFIVEPELIEDRRGCFARSWSQREFAAHGLNPRLAEANFSLNRKKGTLRGMHFQLAPQGQVKLVRCTAGAIYDVIIDLRPGSATFKQWIAVELSGTNHRQLYIPEGFAHGFQTLARDTEVLYHMSEYFAPESARGIRWNDPAFAIEWPLDVRAIIDRDNSYEDWDNSQINQVRA